MNTFEIPNHAKVIPISAPSLLKVELLHYHLTSPWEYQNIADWEFIFVTIPSICYIKTLK